MSSAPGMVSTFMVAGVFGSDGQPVAVGIAVLVVMMAVIVIAVCAAIRENRK